MKKDFSGKSSSFSDAPLALIKRAMDVAVAVVLLLILLPAMLLIGVAVLLSSPGPVFYCQKRVGRRGKEFVMLKFRTMHAKSCAPEPLMENRDLVKRKGDARITRVGAHLRRCSLDELPQLWNVLQGDMSLIGPRPLPYCMLEASPCLLSERAKVRPGMTGLWQIRARHLNTNIGDMIEHDLEYVRGLSIRRDCKIAAMTIAAVIGGHGAV